MYMHVQFWQPLVSSGALHLVFETGFLTGLECLKASWPAILSDLLISASPLVAFCVSTEDQIQVIMTVQHSVDLLSYFPSLWFFEDRREKKIKFTLVAASFCFTCFTNVTKEFCGLRFFTVYCLWISHHFSCFVHFQIWTPCLDSSTSHFFTTYWSFYIRHASFSFTRGMQLIVYTFPYHYACLIFCNEAKNGLLKKSAPNTLNHCTPSLKVASQFCQNLLPIYIDSFTSCTVQLWPSLQEIWFLCVWCIHQTLNCILQYCYSYNN